MYPYMIVTAVLYVLWHSKNSNNNKKKNKQSKWNNDNELTSFHIFPQILQVWYS